LSRTVIVETLKRIILIVVGYVLAALASGQAVAAAAQFFGPRMLQEGRMIDQGLIVGLFIGGFAVVPAAVVVLVGEQVRLRFWAYYAVAGSAIGCALGWMFMDEWQHRWVGLGFGVVAGLIYWGVVGRQAGALRDLPKIYGHVVTLGLVGAIAAFAAYAMLPTWF
jgi:hypothetical protein